MCSSDLGYALRDEDLRTMDEILTEIDAITPERVAEVAGRYLPPERHYLLTMGPGR